MPKSSQLFEDYYKEQINQAKENFKYRNASLNYRKSIHQNSPQAFLKVKHRTCNVGQLLMYIANEKEEKKQDCNQFILDTNKEYTQEKILKIESERKKTLFNELYDVNGNKIENKGELSDIYKKWKKDYKIIDFEEKKQEKTKDKSEKINPKKKRNTRLATHFILSTKGDVNSKRDQQAVIDSVHETMYEKYGKFGFDYVISLHKDTKNLHAHVIMHNWNLETKKKIRVSKSDILETRIKFAKELTKNGLKHKATLRRDDEKILKEAFKNQKILKKDMNYLSYFAKKNYGKDGVDYLSHILQKKQILTSYLNRLKELEKEEKKNTKKDQTKKNKIEFLKQNKKSFEDSLKKNQSSISKFKESSEELKIEISNFKNNQELEKQRFSVLNRYGKDGVDYLENLHKKRSWILKNTLNQKNKKDDFFIEYATINQQIYNLNSPEKSLHVSISEFKNNRKKQEEVKSHIESFKKKFGVGADEYLENIYSTKRFLSKKENLTEIEKKRLNSVSEIIENAKEIDENPTDFRKKIDSFLIQKHKRNSLKKKAEELYLKGIINKDIDSCRKKIQESCKNKYDQSFLFKELKKISFLDSKEIKKKK